MFWADSFVSCRFSVHSYVNTVARDQVSLHNAWVDFGVSRAGGSHITPLSGCDEAAVSGFPYARHIFGRQQGHNLQPSQVCTCTIMLQ